MRTMEQIANPNVDRMFRAFSDRTRLRILSMLNEGEMCVGDISTVLRIVQPAASRHLAYLRKAGLVKARRKGVWKYYSLAPAESAFHVKLLECLTDCFGSVPEIRTDRIRYRKLRKSGGCC